MPLTKSEIEAILVARASKGQNHHHAHPLGQSELHTNLSWLGEGGAFEASPNYNNTGIPLPTNVDRSNVLSCSDEQLNALDSFAQPQSVKPAEVFGALTSSAPHATDQSG